jgi:hypothetical protein
LLNRLASYLVAIRKLSSPADQVLVSGGNFLTIAICAHALPLAEQGKFTYIVASYIVVLLLNIAGQDGKKDSIRLGIHSKLVFVVRFKNNMAHCFSGISRKIFLLNCNDVT